MKNLRHSLLIFTLILCAALLSGCWSVFVPSIHQSSVSYDQAERYTMGGASLNAAVEKLQIDWIAGRVQLARHSEDTITFSEEANRKLDADNSLYYWLDGDTLHIQYCRAGQWNLTNLEKELTLWLPEDLQLRELEINSVSAQLELESIDSAQLELESVSGAIQITDCTVSEKADLASTSGTIQASLLGALQELEADTVSGAVKISAEAIDMLEANSASGALSLRLRSAPRKLELETVSGSVTLYLPEDAGFQLRFDSVSGDFSSALACRADGKRYLFGSGTGDYTVDTTSGNLSIHPIGSQEG